MRLHPVCDWESPPAFPPFPLPERPRVCRGGSGAVPCCHPMAAARGQCCCPWHSPAPLGDPRAPARLQLGQEQPPVPKGVSVQPRALGWGALCSLHSPAHRGTPGHGMQHSRDLASVKWKKYQAVIKQNCVHLPLTLAYILRDLILPFPVVICLHIPDKHSLQALWMLSPLPAITVFACSCLFLSFFQSILIVWWLILGFVF